MITQQENPSQINPVPATANQGTGEKGLLRVISILLSHWPLLLVVLIALMPLFADLGGDYMWADEGDTAVFALSILKNGVPKAWDGKTFTDSDFGARLNDDLVMVTTPWVPYYVTAASFLIFGENTFAARFPFAVAGWMTLPLLYYLVYRYTENKRAALASAIFLLFSVQFLLYARQCRYYSLLMLFSCVLLLAFQALEKRHGKIFFALISILLFHCHPIPAATILAALGFLSLFYSPVAVHRKSFWMLIPVIALFTFPWLLLGKEGIEKNSQFLSSLDLIGPRLFQFFIEYSATTPLVAWMLVLIVWGSRKAYKYLGHKGGFVTEKKEPVLTPDKMSSRKISMSRVRKASQSGTSFRRSGVQLHKSSANLGSYSKTDMASSPFIPLAKPKYQVLLVIITTIILVSGLAMAVTQSTFAMQIIGTRYCAGLIPLGAAVTGVLVAILSRSKTWILCILIALFALTNLGRNFIPWVVVQEQKSLVEGREPVVFPVPLGWVNKVFKMQIWGFMADLWQSNPGVVQRISTYINEHAKPDDILITNYCWEPVYFHTRLAQGLKIMPHWEIYETAKKHQLPDYVFDVTGARWVAWRWGWDGYRDYHGEEVLFKLQQMGASVTRVATFAETRWENMPHIHHRRFASVGHLYPTNVYPEADIFKIDWPLTNQSPEPAKSTSRVQ